MELCSLTPGSQESPAHDLGVRWQVIFEIILLLAVLEAAELHAALLPLNFALERLLFLHGN